MVQLQDFRHWIVNNTTYSNRTISNTISRLKRADSLLGWFDDPVYIFRLEQLEEFQNLSCSVKSQIRKAVKLYFDYVESNRTVERKI